MILSWMSDWFPFWTIKNQQARNRYKRCMSTVYSAQILDKMQSLAEGELLQLADRHIHRLLLFVLMNNRLTANLTDLTCSRSWISVMNLVPCLPLAETIRLTAKGLMCCRFAPVTANFYCVQHQKQMDERRKHCKLKDPQDFRGHLHVLINLLSFKKKLIPHNSVNARNQVYACTQYRCRNSGHPEMRWLAFCKVCCLQVFTWQPTAAAPPSFHNTLQYFAQILPGEMQRKTAPALPGHIWIHDKCKAHWEWQLPISLKVNLCFCERDDVTATACDIYSLSGERQWAVGSHPQVVGLPDASI